MKTILSAALVLGFCGLAGAEGEKADPVGTWKCEYEIGDQKRTSTLTITKDGDKLAGTMSWPDQKETKLKEVKLKDGELTFSAERELKDNKYNVEYIYVGGQERAFYPARALLFRPFARSGVLLVEFTAWQSAQKSLNRFPSRSPSKSP